HPTAGRHERSRRRAFGPGDHRSDRRDHEAVEASGIVPACGGTGRITLGGTNMATCSRTRLPFRLFAIGCTFAGRAITGCGDSYSTLRDRWDYYSLREVRTELPSLMDRQWARRRNYTPDEMLAVQPGGSQTLLIARVTRPPVYNDVAQLDEQVSHTF